jgi:hypothetical protein
MDRIRFVTQGDQRILLLDFTNCTAQEVSAIADQAPAIVAQEPSGSVLVVADFSGAEFSRNAVEHIKIATVFDRAYIKRAAWVLTGNLVRSRNSTGLKRRGLQPRVVSCDCPSPPPR